MKPWTAAAIGFAGAALYFVWPPAAVGISFAAFVMAVGTTFAFNVPMTRLAVFAVVLAHTAVVYGASGSVPLALSVLTAALAIAPPTELEVRFLGKDQLVYLTSPFLLAVAIGLFAAAWPTGAWGWAAAPSLLVGALFSLICVQGTLDIRKSARSEQQVRVGAPAPDIALPTRPDRREFHLSDERGRFVLVCFLRGDWCPICQVFMRIYKKEAPLLNERKVKLVVVSPSSGEEADTFAKEIGVDYLLVIDEECRVARRFGAMLEKAKHQGKDVPLPISILIDPTGIVRYVSKPEDVTMFAAQSELSQILGGGAPAIAS